VIRTFREWGIYIDQAFFLGGMSKDQVLRRFKPHIFFDDQDIHGIPASKVAPSGKVPYSRKSPLHKTKKPKDK
jgi:5'-nucleotidase